VSPRCLACPWISEAVGQASAAPQPDLEKKDKGLAELPHLPCYNLYITYIFYTYDIYQVVSKATPLRMRSEFSPPRVCLLADLKKAFSAPGRPATPRGASARDAFHARSAEEGDWQRAEPRQQQANMQSLTTCAWSEPAAYPFVALK